MKVFGKLLKDVKQLRFTCQYLRFTILTVAKSQKESTMANTEYVHRNRNYRVRGRYVSMHAPIQNGRYVSQYQNITYATSININQNTLNNSKFSLHISVYYLFHYSRIHYSTSLSSAEPLFYRENGGEGMNIASNRQSFYKHRYTAVHRLLTEQYSEKTRQNLSRIMPG